jgi:hypothetical protein
MHMPRSLDTRLPAQLYYSTRAVPTLLLQLVNPSLQLALALASDRRASGLLITYLGDVRSIGCAVPSQVG